MSEGTTGGACVLGGRERAGQPPESLPSLRGTRRPPSAGRPARGPPSGPSKQTRPPLTDGRGWGGGSARKGRLCGGAVQKCPAASRRASALARLPPAPPTQHEPSPPSACPPPASSHVSPRCLSGLVPDDHRARHCHYHLLIRAELPGRQEWQAHVPVPAEEPRPRPFLVAGHPPPFPSSSCRPPTRALAQQHALKGLDPGHCAGSVSRMYLDHQTQDVIR